MDAKKGQRSDNTQRHDQSKVYLHADAKLNELIASQKTASNLLIDIEDLSETELETLKRFYIKLSALAESEGDVFSTHSIDEAEKIHRIKSTKKKPGGE